MTTHTLLLLPGDGIGVETIAEVERLIAFFNAKSNAVKFETDTRSGRRRRPMTSTASRSPTRPWRRRRRPMP